MDTPGPSIPTPLMNGGGEELLLMEKPSGRPLKVIKASPTAMTTHSSPHMMAHVLKCRPKMSSQNVAD